ncbi:MAG: putative bromoperoxidase [Capsulimonas sp.]|nr:putative bromoperoxidase [Capsulimonas sp.]
MLWDGLARRECVFRSRRANPSLGFDKGQQIGVELILVCGSEAMRGAGVDLQGGVLNKLSREKRRSADGDDLVGVAVRNQCRDIELLQVLGEVGFGELLDAIQHALDPGLHALEPERIDRSLVGCGALTVEAVEWDGKVLEELRAVVERVRANAVEDFDRQAAGVGVRLEHQWRHCAQKNGFGDA